MSIHLLITNLPMELIHKIYGGRRYRLICRWTNNHYLSSLHFVANNPKNTDWLCRSHCDLNVDHMYKITSECTNLDRLCIAYPFVMVDDDKNKLIHAKKLMISIKNKDLRIIANMKNLITLYITNSQLSDITHLRSLDNLQVLDLSTTMVENISPLSNMIKLVSLCLENTYVRDITCLRNLTKLVILDLSDTLVEDISVAVHMVSLYKLSLNDTPIISIAPLCDLPMLRKLRIKNTNIIDLPLLRTIPLLSVKM